MPFREPLIAALLRDRNARPRLSIRRLSILTIQKSGIDQSNLVKTDRICSNFFGEAPTATST